MWHECVTSLPEYLLVKNYISHCSIKLRIHPALPYQLIGMVLSFLQQVLNLLFLLVNFSWKTWCSSHEVRRQLTDRCPCTLQSNNATVGQRSYECPLLGSIDRLSSVWRLHQHSISYLGDSFTGQKTQPTVSEYWRNRRYKSKENPEKANSTKYSNTTNTHTYKKNTKKSPSLNNTIGWQGESPTEGRVAKPERRWGCRHSTPHCWDQNSWLSRVWRLTRHVNT